VIEGQIFDGKPTVAILTGEAVAQKDIKAGECRAPGERHILLERYNAWQAKFATRRMHSDVIFRNDIHALKKGCFNRILPWPERKRKITEWPIIGVQYQGVAGFKRRRHALSLHRDTLPNEAMIVFCLL